MTVNEVRRIKNLPGLKVATNYSKPSAAPQPHPLPTEPRMKNRKLLQLLKDNARAEGPIAIRMDATETDVHVYVNDVIDSYWGRQRHSADHGAGWPARQNRAPAHQQPRRRRV